MSDDPSTPSGFSTATILALALATAAVTVGAGLAVESGQVPGFGGGVADETAEVTDFQAFEPQCGTHRSSNSSSSVRPADGGVELSINETVPVAARDSELTADLSEVGERRYLLDLQRTAGDRSTDCYLEMRYNVTVRLPDRNGYTLIRTVDRTYHAVEYGDRNLGGSSGSNLDPRPPSMTDAEWEEALNASDDYFYNESRGHGSLG